MSDEFYIVIAYGEKVIFRNGTILRFNKSIEECKNDIDLYIDRIVKVPDDLAKDEAEKLIREKKAYKLNPFKAYEEIKTKILKNSKHLSRKEFNDKLITETQKLLKKIRVIDKNAFGENFENYNKSFQQVSEELKKMKKK